MSIDDIPLNPATAFLLSRFRDGCEPHRSAQFQYENTEGIVKFLRELPDRTKGCVIIDLLTVVETLAQSVTLLQTEHMEEMERARE